MFFWPRLDLPRGRSWPSSSPCSWFRAMASVAWLSKPVRRRSVCFWRPEIISRVSSFWWSYIYNYIYISYLLLLMIWLMNFVRFCWGDKELDLWGILDVSRVVSWLKWSQQDWFFVAAQLQQFGLVCDARNQGAAVNYVQQTTDINYKRYI